MKTPDSTNPIPAADTWWVRRCNGKRYYLRDAPKTGFIGSRLYVWIYEEGVNRCLHLPLKTLLSRYDQYTGPHATIITTKEN